MLSWWSCQSPIAHRCSLLNHPNSSHRGIFKLNTKFDADSLHYLLSHFNAVTTQYTCSLNSVYHPHWLVQWSRHCSHMCIPAHSPWLPCYIDIVHTIFIILTMAGLFLDRPRIPKWTIDKSNDYLNKIRRKREVGPGLVTVVSTLGSLSYFTLWAAHTAPTS